MNRRKVAWFLAILAFFIFVGSPFIQSANAVAIVDDALILVIIAALAGMHIYFTAQATDDAVAWLRTQINASGIDFSGSNYGTNKLSNVLINNRFLIKVSLLAAYIKSQFNLADNSTYSINTQRFMYLNDGTRVYTYNVSMPLNGAWPREGDPVNGTVFSVYEQYEFENGTIIRTNIYEDESRLLEVVGSNGSVIRYAYLGRDCEGYIFCMNYFNFSGSGTPPTRLCGISSNGYINGINANNWGQLFSVQSNDVLGLRTGVIDIPSDQVIADNAGIIHLPLPWSKTMPQILDDIDASVPEGTLIGNTVLEIESAGTVEDQIDQEATNADHVSANPENYTVSGLASVFPFCIPFDIYSFFECLAADPVAPVVNWRFYVPGICDETITIDLSQFDTVAQVVRTMELLAFIVGLALVTREKFLRG